MIPAAAPERSKERAVGQGFAMTDLEETLRTPGGGEKKVHIIHTLDALLEALAAARKSGLSRRKYDQTLVVEEALIAAKSVIVHFPVPDDPYLTTGAKQNDDRLQC